MKLIENERINKNILNKLNESVDKEALKQTILSKVFSYYPDIDEETEDYFIGLSLEELISEVKNFGWSDILDELEDELKELDESDNKLEEGFFNLYHSFRKLYGIDKYSPEELIGVLNDMKRMNRISDKDYETMIKFANDYQELIDRCGYESSLAESDNYEVKKVLNIEDGSDEEATLNALEDRNLKDEFNSLKPKTKKLYKDLLPINPNIHVSRQMADEFAKLYNIDAAIFSWLANVGRHAEDLEEKELTEATQSVDEITKEYQEAYKKELDLNHVPCVKAVDKFLSGWGYAEGKSHYIIVLCGDSVEAANLEDSMKHKADKEGLSRVRRDFNAKAPKNTTVSYVVGKNATAWK